MMQQIFYDPIVVLDTETTGRSNAAEVIEIGGVCLDEYGRVRSTFSSLIKPTVINAKAREALAINKIPEEDLNKAPSPNIVKEMFWSWYNEIPIQNDRPLCLAYNVSFDKRMMDNFGIKLPWGRCLSNITHMIAKDAGAVFLNKVNVPKVPNLEEACSFFELIYPEDAHRALADAEVTAQIAVLIAAKAPQYLTKYSK
jgi:DNA polymerase III epsilon subunit-like protein